jgi:uncharacterized protein (DUF58 family)
VQALGDVVFGTLLIGIVGPAVSLARARVRVVDAPTDITAGLPAQISVAASTRLRVRPAQPAGTEDFVGPRRGRRQDGDVITLLPPRRGVHHTVTLDIATAAPFALQWWTRRIVLPLPTALHIAPRRGQPVWLPERPHEHAGETTQRAPADLGDPRGARPYRSGDNRRHVHWRATAHTGELMVREAESPSAEPIKLLVELPRDADAAERVTESVLATMIVLLDRGASVLLATTEPAGPVEALVEDRRGAGRRLARAVAQSGSPPAPGVPGLRAEVGP